ncbi:MAG: ATP-binding protein [Myxococcota bacterium]
MSEPNLEAECAALRTTVEVLMEVAEERQAGEGRQTPFQLFQQTAELERVVREKTLALEQAVNELVQTQSRLVQAQKLEAVGQLAAGVAHEINTPMQYIGDNTRFLKKAFEKVMTLVSTFEEMAATEDWNAARVAEAMRAIKAARLDFLRRRVPRALDQTIEGVEAVSAIVMAMKEFSHPGSDERAPVDLNHLLETICTVSRNEWKYVAELEFDVDPALPTVDALGGALKQVFLNLIVNAAHAIEAVHPTGETKGTIRIVTGQEGGHVVVQISDTGCGIPEEIRHRIFDPFFTTKEVGKGTGQGLAIAHSIVVDRHQGELSASANPDGGTTFVIRLPLPGAA